MLIVRMRCSLLIISFLFFHSVFGQTSAISKPDSVHIFKAKMADVPFFPPGCGGISYAVAYRFKVIESNDRQFLNRFVIIIIGCPELYGPDFFLNDKVYSIKAARNNDGSVVEGSINPTDYKNQKLPIFWEREI